MYLSPDYTIKAQANLGKLFSGYISQVGYEHVLADSCAECLGGIGSGPAERSVRGENPEASWPDRDDSGDALRAPIAVTVTGQRLITGKHQRRWETAPNLL